EGGDKADKVKLWSDDCWDETKTLLGEFDEGKKLFKLMVKRGCESDKVFGIMQLLVNGIAKDSKVEEAKELIAQVKEFTRNVDLWNEVEAALPH
ncbi:hypothetical protein HID58_033018, partial [Brassica napus]